MCSIWSLVSPKSEILALPPGFYGRFASLRSAWKGLDQARLHLTLSRHVKFELQIFGILYLHGFSKKNGYVG